MIQFVGKSLLALLIFSVILKFGMIVMFCVAIALTAKVMTA